MPEHDDIPALRRRPSAAGRRRRSLTKGAVALTGAATAYATPALRAIQIAAAQGSPPPLGGTLPPVVDTFHCQVSQRGIDDQGRHFVELIVQVTGSGLARIFVEDSYNAVVAWHFLPGTTAPVLVRGTEEEVARSGAAFELLLYSVADVTMERGHTCEALIR